MSSNNNNNNKRYLAALTKAIIKNPRKPSKKELMETKGELLAKQNEEKFAKKLKERQEQERLARQIRLTQNQFDGYNDMGIDSNAEWVDGDRLRKS
ncbi:hypothetical protein A0J61_10628 [Choanephora cucurbitarum]|uniref:Uncharacterized protein n=1 Tax=Choanephora cucurbitarum TaxID=101091 RepID=A0A1C7MWZ2_9FUNG|nr:hypothetical protein A0J61_10628 [Choanephora cucurbitarum]